MTFLFRPLFGSPSADDDDDDDDGGGGSGGSVKETILYAACLKAKAASRPTAL